MIRVWERRYRALRPSRTEGNQRLYSEEDVERLRLLGQLCRAGHRIGRIADAPLKELRALAVGTAASADLPGEPDGADGGIAGLLTRCHTAVEDLDGERLGRILDAARVFLPVSRLLADVVLPLMRWIGDQWKAGSIRIMQEHVATVVVRSLLDRLATETPPPGSAPLLVLATPPGEWHELGALAARVTALAAGWRVLYLGVNVPPDEVVEAAGERKAAAVALGITFSAADRATVAAVREIRKRLEGKSFLMAGGPAAARCAKAAGLKPAQVVASMAAFARTLDRIRAKSAAAL